MRSLKILKILGLHFEHLICDYYRRHRDVQHAPYEQHLEGLESFYPVHLTSFRKTMRELGHETEIIVYDLETLQQNWARENGYRFSQAHWRVDIILAQIEKMKPDVVYLQDIHAIPHFVRKRLKTLCPSIKKVVAFKGFPGAEGELMDLDMLFAGNPKLIEDYRKDGIKSELIYHSFDTRILENYPNLMTQQREISLAFMGYSGYAGYGVHHRDRYFLLQRLIEETPIKLWLTENKSQLDWEKSRNEDFPGPLLKLYPRRTQQSCFGLDMYSLLGNTQICFNRHTEAGRGDIGNMRMFEATGMGACLLNDDGVNLKELFEPDDEIVVYHSDDECLEKIKFLMDNPIQARKIAEKGHQRTLRRHNLRQRCEAINDALQKLFE